jgi:hypothetical protein
MATDSGIDPRYAAQFQRGFDPAQHTVEVPRDYRGPVRIEGGPPPAVRRVPDPPRIAERVPVPVLQRDEPEAGAEEDADLPVRPRAEWAVLGAGVGMIVVAIGLFWAWAEDQARGFYGPSSYDVPSQLRTLALSGLPGPLLVAGVVAVVLWIVLRSLDAPGGRR